MENSLFRQFRSQHRVNESLPNGNKFASRIGIDQRNANTRKTKMSITPENTNSSFPAISTIDDQKIRLAYTETVNEGSHVVLGQVVIN